MKLIFASVLLIASVCAQTTPDYTNLYDHLVVEEINGRLREAEVNFQKIDDQVNQFLKSKDENLRKQIVIMLNMTLPDIKADVQKIETQLKKTNLTVVEKFILEKARDDTELLIHTLTGLQDIINGKTPEDIIISDSLEQQANTAEQKAMAILKEIHDYNQSKDIAAKTKIIDEIEAELPVVQKLSKALEDELIKIIGHGRAERLRVERLLTDVRRIETTLTEAETNIKA